MEQRAQIASQRERAREGDDVWLLQKGQRMGCMFSSFFANGNQEVAYEHVEHRSYREADRAERPNRAGLAGLTDYKEFGAWFRVQLDTPFVPGKATKGNITYPGSEHLVMEVVVQKMEHERLFSFLWHPYAVDPNVDYSKEPPTLVEFILEKTASGTLLVVTESGFDALPAARRTEAFRMNDGGWAEQMTNIQTPCQQRATVVPLRHGSSVAAPRSSPRWEMRQGCRSSRGSAAARHGRSLS